MMMTTTNNNNEQMTDDFKFYRQFADKNVRFKDNGTTFCAKVEMIWCPPHENRIRFKLSNGIGHSRTNANCHHYYHLNNEPMNELTNYQRLTREGQRLDDKLARYMTANGLDLDDVKAEIENKTCRLPARVREYVTAYFKVQKLESDRMTESERDVAENSIEQIKSGSIGVPNLK